MLPTDCVAYSVGDFHPRFLENKSLAIACPKLDNEPDYYQQKPAEMFDEAEINTLSILTVEVPCCRVKPNNDSSLESSVTTKY